MFSSFFKEAKANVLSALETARTPSLVETLRLVTEDEELSVSDLARLLRLGDLSESDPRLVEFRESFHLRFNRAKGSGVRNIAPSYLSSFCIDTCGYCQFSANRKDTQRSRLSLEESAKEVDAIIAEGNKVLEFTLATDPALSPSNLAKYVKQTCDVLVESPGSGVLLCSDHFTQEEYHLLREAGLWGMVQWDESLDEERFKKWHKGSPRKGDFFERMNTHDHALRAGLEVATGALLGLADHHFDVLMQVEKARYLQREYERTPFVFGTPRIKSIGSKSLEFPNAVNDTQYDVSLMIYKLALPHMSRWLQTREDPATNLRNVLDGDVMTYRCGEVKPGGWKVNSDTLDTARGGQFKVKEQAKEVYERDLASLGFTVDYAWIR